MARQTNVGDQLIFMCFESNRRIGKIELEGIGADKDYAIGDLVFEVPW